MILICITTAEGRYNMLVDVYRLRVVFTMKIIQACPPYGYETAGRYTKATMKVYVQSQGRIYPTKGYITDMARKRAVSNSFHHCTYL